MQVWPIGDPLLSLLRQAIAYARAQRGGTFPEPPALAARFERCTSDDVGGCGPRRQSFYFRREHGIVETFEPVARHGEIWLRRDDGEIELFHVLHESRCMVQYEPDDLRARDRYPDWRTLTRLIDRRQLSRMNPCGQREVGGRLARRYRGDPDRRYCEVLWLQAEQVPARVCECGERQTRSMELAEIYAFGGSSLPLGHYARDEIASDQSFRGAWCFLP